jgi:hypothetical protein
MRRWTQGDRSHAGAASSLGRATGIGVIGSLDTHESVKSLTAAGFTDAQAEALTAVVKHAVDVDVSTIATKADLADVRRDLSTEIADLRRELATEIADVRRELAQLELRLIKWVVGIGISATLAVGGMIWTATQSLLRGMPHP